MLPGNGGRIAVRADQCVLGAANGQPHVTGRVSMIEYQGPLVRVALATEDGLEAAVLVPDQAFYRQAVEHRRGRDLVVAGSRGPQRSRTRA